MLMKKKFVSILNFIEKIIVGKLYNTTLITAGLLTFLTMEKAVEVLPETLWILG